jgi:hypothetical protein
MRRPAYVVAVGYGVALLLLLATHDWDPLFFASSGPGWARHDPDGVRRADGFIYHAIAQDPLGASARFGAYRADRILYPLLARLLAFGRADLIPWSLVLVNWMAIVLGTEIVSRLLGRVGAPGWMALAYGAWAGLGAALLKDTAEPVTYLAALLGIWWLQGGRTLPACAAFVCALLGRETALLLVGPHLLQAGSGRSGARRWLPALTVLGLWGAWLLLVRAVLQAPLISGRRLHPLTGFAATRALDLPFSLAWVVIPAAAVAVLAGRGLLRAPTDARLWAALLNALVALSLPPGTAAMLWHSARVSTGLVAATVLATPLEDVAPRAWRGLAVVYASSALWTIAAVARYLFWDVVVLPGG